MFDRERAAAAIEGLTPFGRGQLTTLCLVRAANVMDDSRIADEFSSMTELVHAIQEYSTRRAEGRQDSGVFDPSILDGRVRDFLGPDEDPHEELPGWGAWAMDIVSLADYVLRTWRAPADSAEKSFNVSLAAYSIAGYLEDDSDSPDVPALVEGEFRRQMEDASRIAAGEEWADLVEPSIELARIYAQWVRHVTV